VVLAFVQELVRHRHHALGELIGTQVAELLAERAERHHRLAIARWPPALPMSAKYLRTNSPALR
jgi:hypothetical protein